MSEAKLNGIYLISDLLEHNKRPTFKDIQTALSRHCLRASQKTVYRYLSELKKMGAPLDKDPATGEYFYKIETFRLKAGVMSSQEQIKVAGLVKNLLSLIKDSPIYDEAEHLLSDLTTIFTDSYHDDYLSKNETKMEFDSDKVIFLGPPVGNLNKEIWDAIYSAIHNKQLIKFSYQSMKRTQPEVRIVQPWQLIFDDGNWNVWGYSYHVKEPRMFTISEMHDFSLYDGKKSAFEVPDNFDFRKTTPGAFGCYSTKEWKEYKFKLTGYAKRHVKNRRFGENQHIEETGDSDNSIILTFTSNQEVPILTKALGWGKECTVLAPSDFVESWRENIRLMQKIAIKTP